MDLEPLELRGKISETLLDAADKAPADMLKTLIDSMVPEQGVALDGNTQSLVDGVTAVKVKEQRGKLIFSVTVDPSKHPGGKNDQEEGHPWDDEMRQDVLAIANARATDHIKAAMSLLDELRIPYSVDANPRGRSLKINRHDFEQAVEPIVAARNEISSKRPASEEERIFTPAEHAAAEAFWHKRDSDRPEQINGAVSGSHLGEENAKRAGWDMRGLRLVG
jgi:hypothetical protein